MKHSTLTSMKFLRLKRALGLPTYQVAGVLEMLWTMAATKAIDGGIGRFTNQDIADFVEWPDDADKLISALVKCGWLDKIDSCRLCIHDWQDHCPNWILGVMKRHNKSFLAKPTKEPTKEATKEPTKEVTKEPTKEPTREVTKEATREVTKEATKETCKEEKEKDLFPSSFSLSPHPSLLSSSSFLQKEKEESPPTPLLKTKKFNPNEAELPFSSLEFARAWADWIKHRIEIKKPLTETSVKNQLAQFREWGEARSIDSIVYTIRMGWRGLQEETRKQAQGQTISPRFDSRPDLAKEPPRRPAYGKSDPERDPEDGLWYARDGEGREVAHDGESWLTLAKWKAAHPEGWKPEYVGRWKAAKSKPIPAVALSDLSVELAGAETHPLRGAS